MYSVAERITAEASSRGLRRERSAERSARRNAECTTRVFLRVIRGNLYCALPVILLLIAYVALGTLYSVIVPLWEAPDELAHFQYVRHLIEERSLPVLGVGNRVVSHHPPLYYLIGALATHWIDTGDMANIKFNPHFHWDGSGGPNMMIHSADEGFPYHGVSLAAHLIRLLSVLTGAVTVLATYFLGRELFPHHRSLALGAAAINAFIPQFVFINSVINNDGLATMFSSLTLLSLVKVVKGHPRSKTLLALGLWLGLGLLTKYSELAFLPLAVLAVWFAAMRADSWRRFFIWCAFILGVAFLLAGWYYLRNWALYGDPVGWRIWPHIYSDRQEPLSWSYLGSLFHSLYFSFWGTFGWGNVRLSETIYNWLGLGSGLGLLGLLVFTIKQRGKRGPSRATKRGLLLLGLSVILVFILVVRFMVSFGMGGSQGRYMFAAISAISILLFLGLTAFVPRRYHWALTALVGGAMFGLATVSLFHYIAPAYAKPPLLSPTEAQSIPHRVDVNYGGKMKLLGYQIHSHRAKPGGMVYVTIYWQSLVKMDRDYSVFVHLLGPDNEPLGQMDVYPGLGRYPTSSWKVGDILPDTYWIRVSSEVTMPCLGRLEVGLYDFNSMERLEAFDEKGNPIGNSLTLGKVKVVGAKPLPFSAQHSLQVKLGEEMALLGYDLNKTVVKPGERIRVTLYWQALKRMDRDYTVFTHLVDEEGQIWAQDDSQPQGGDYPTSVWDEEEVVKDEHDLLIKPDTPLGEYQLEIGMYLLETGERLAVLDDQEQTIDDRVLLGQIRVSNP